MNDPSCLEAFDDMMQSLSQPLDRLLEALADHAEQTPQWMMLFSFGKWVIEYDNMRNLGNDCVASYNGALALVLSDPSVQALLQRFVQQGIDKGLGL
jgi:hypothetical protein